MIFWTIGRGFLLNKSCEKILNCVMVNNYILKILMLM